MKKSLLVLMLLAASAAQASIAPPCDSTSFEGMALCSAITILAVAEPPPPPVPEPGTLSLFVAGVAALTMLHRRRRPQ
jgi:hypothetical protein